MQSNSLDVLNKENNVYLRREMWRRTPSHWV